MLALVAAVTLAAAACGGPEPADQPPTGFDESAPEATDPAPGEDQDEQGAEEDFRPLDGDPEEVAIRDAADRAGVDLGEVEVVTNEPVTWSDGSLGCPEDGQMYTQALVEGYRIVVEAGGETLHYHGQAGEAPTHCAEPTDPAETGDATVEE
ncbi:hypothetical protein GCM10011354_03290 [Egicoccus halophilus]|uniref:Uncharacterized protein n=2 Tax=Egicoccus halophilus TaxID=1670830 RepID=A0A8J3AC54_9ACTN|nr:hypothetical protein GCM10011354_03290 [Egicoccus halophilus]